MQRCEQEHDQAQHLVDYYLHCTGGNIFKQFSGHDDEINDGFPNKETFLKDNKYLLIAPHFKDNTVILLTGISEIKRTDILFQGCMTKYFRTTPPRLNTALENSSTTASGRRIKMAARSAKLFLFFS